MLSGIHFNTLGKKQMQEDKTRMANVGNFLN